MTNSKIFIQNTTKMIHLKKYIRKVKHAAPILYFVWQFCLNQWELIQYNLSFPFYWSRTYLSHQTSHRNVSGPQIFPLSQPYKFSYSLCSIEEMLLSAFLLIQLLLSYVMSSIMPVTLCLHQMGYLSFWQQ